MGRMIRRAPSGRPAVRAALVVLAVAGLVMLAACGGGSSGGDAKGSARSRPSASSSSPSTTTSATTAGARLDPARPCVGAPPPPVYDHVVVIMMENRSWPLVGGPGFASMPYLNGLAKSCSYYEDWTETNRVQNSLTQYIGLTSGVDNARTVDDCSPGPSCHSVDDNIFRQVRISGRTARNFVDAATEPCTVGGNAAKHIPALYYQGTYQDATGTHSDADFCTREVRPLAELDVDNLPTFAYITPDQCHDGHDCSNQVADDWLRQQVGALLAGKSYQAGKTAVFVMWDEDYPVANLQIAPSAQPGPRPGKASHKAALKTVMQMLGITPLASVAAEPDLRTTTPL